MPVVDFAAPDRAAWGEPGFIGDVPLSSRLGSLRPDGGNDKATRDNGGPGNGNGHGRR
jgi:hypothetical protein